MIANIASYMYIGVYMSSLEEENMSRGPWIHLKVTTTVLSKLFNKQPSTIRRWIREGRIDPTSIEDIIDKFNNPSKLDYRSTRYSGKVVVEKV